MVEVGENKTCGLTGPGKWRSKRTRIRFRANIPMWRHIFADRSLSQEIFSFACWETATYQIFLIQWCFTVDHEETPRGSLKLLHGTLV